MQFLKAIKNNPKKSAVGTILFGYLTKWLNTLHENHLHRHASCQNFKYEGLKPIHFNDNPKKITIFYNPAASDGKASKLFAKNAKPILNLSGCDIQIVKLDYEGQAKQLMGVLEETDMIVAAGGDGTVNEVVTGLLRRPDACKWTNVPIGVIPLGRTNTICNLLSNGNISSNQNQWIVDSTINLFQGKTTKVDVLKIESEDGKKAFGLTDFRWGTYRDAQAKQNKYWYFRSWKKYVTYFFRSLHQDARIPNQLELSYNDPVKVVQPKQEGQVLGPLKVQQTNILEKMVSSLLPTWITGVTGGTPKSLNVEQVDESVEKEEENVEVEEVFQNIKSNIETIEFMASANTHKLSEKNELPSIKLSVEEKEFNFMDFVTNGPKSVIDGRHNPVNPVLNIECSKFKIVPKNKSESFFSIDNENFEVFPCTVEVLPNVLNMIYKE